jgi:hypothetical protein
MNAAQLSGLALIAFGATEFGMRKGQAAKSFQRTAADKVGPNYSAYQQRTWRLISLVF